MRWRFTKILNFLFIPQWLRAAGVILLLALVPNFIFVEVYFFFFFSQNLWTTFEKQTQSLSTTCLHHSAKTRLDSAERFDWIDAALLQRAVKRLMGLILNLIQVT